MAAAVLFLFVAGKQSVITRAGNAATPTASDAIITVNFSTATTEPNLSMHVAAHYNSALCRWRLRRLPCPALRPPAFVGAGSAGMRRAVAFRVYLAMLWRATPSAIRLCPGTLEPTLNCNAALLSTSSACSWRRERRTILSWSYIPRPLQNGTDASGDRPGFTHGPCSLAAWADMHSRLASSLRLAEPPVPSSAVIHELYNEPDLAWAFSGTWKQYVDMALAAATGILRADPAARLWRLRPSAQVNAGASSGVSQSVAARGTSVHAYGSENVWQTHVQRAASVQIRQRG